MRKRGAVAVTEGAEFDLPAGREVLKDHVATQSADALQVALDEAGEPAAFSRMLMTGGPAHRNRVSAVWYQAGRIFETCHGNTLLAEFAQ